MALAKPVLVFFGLEKSDYDFKYDCDISQIVMKCGSSTFNKYVDPTKKISEEISKVNHLTIKNGQIYKDKVRKRSLPLNVVLEQLYQYLKGLNGRCTLIAHKCCFFSAVPLIRAIRDLAMENKFNSVIAGFTDTFPMFKTKFPNTDPDKFQIHILAREINFLAKRSPNCGRSIKHNVEILEKVALHHFSAEELGPKRSFLSQLEITEGFNAKMRQAACCPVVDFFVVEKAPKNKKKALKKQAHENAEKTEEHNDLDELREHEFEDSEDSRSSPKISANKTAEDVALIRDNESSVTNKSVKIL